MPTGKAKMIKRRMTVERIEDIMVTPEMIAAGVSALPYLPEEACNYQEAKLVTSVYRAMRSLAPDRRPCPHK
jgi:hypothetical protein